MKPFSVFVRLHKEEADALAMLARQEGRNQQDAAYQIVADELRRRGLVKVNDEGEYFKTPNDARVVERK